MHVCASCHRKFSIDIGTSEKSTSRNSGMKSKMIPAPFRKGYLCGYIKMVLRFAVVNFTVFYVRYTLFSSGVINSFYAWTTKPQTLITSPVQYFNRSLWRKFLKVYSPRNSMVNFYILSGLLVARNQATFNKIFC